MFHTLKKSRVPRLFMAAVLGTALVLTGCGKKDGGDKVVATYKGGEITSSELTKFTAIFFSQYGDIGGNPEMQEYLVKQLATMKILAGRASEEAKKEGAANTKDQLKKIEDNFNTQGKDAFDKQLKQMNVSKDDLEKYINLSTVVVADMNRKVTDQQVKDSYDQKLKEDPHAFDVASVAHILIMLKDPADQTKDLRTKEEALKRANEVKGKLDQGGDFAALAKEYSDDPGSKDNGGKYENEKLATTMWDPAFKKAAVEQPVGQVGAPFESSFGYHIMRVDKREAEAFDKVKDQLKSEGAEGMISEFITKELPTLDFKTDLPKPSASPEASPGAAPAASSAASPAGK